MTAFACARVEADGAAIAVRTLGAGPALVLLPGLAVPATISMRSPNTSPPWDIA
jgi:hypothetical protein